MPHEASAQLVLWLVGGPTRPRCILHKSRSRSRPSDPPVPTAIGGCGAEPKGWIACSESLMLPSPRCVAQVSVGMFSKMPAPDSVAEATDHVRRPLSAPGGFVSPYAPGRSISAECSAGRAGSAETSWGAWDVIVERALVLSISRSLGRIFLGVNGAVHFNSISLC